MENVTTNNIRSVVTVTAQGPQGPKGDPGLVDGIGTTLHLSGSVHSGSGGETVLTALTVTGSILPEGSGSWDLGSLENPWRDLFITTASIKFVSRATGKVVSSLSSDNKTRLKQEHLDFLMVQGC